MPTKRFRLLAAISLVVALLPFFLLCFYNQPYLDDFAWATLFRNRGWLSAQTILYQQINGRFFASFLLTAGNPLSYGGPATLGLASLVLNLITLGSLWGSVHCLLRQVVSPLSKLLLASGLFLFFIALIPDIYSSLYWFASQVTHHLASLFLLLIPVSVARFHQVARRSQKRGWYAFAAMGAVITGGSSELVALLLGWLLLLACGISLSRQQRYCARLWASLLILLLGALCIDALAPGNLQRLHPATADAAGLAARLHQLWQPAWLLGALRRFFFTPGICLLILCPLPLAPLAPRLLAIRPPGLRLPLLGSVGMLLGGVLLGTCLMQLEVRTPEIASRCANVLLWWLLLGWLVACWAALPEAIRRRSQPSLAVRGAVGLLLLVFMAIPVRRAWYEVVVEAPKWRQQCWARYAFMQRVAKTTPHVLVQVPPIRHVRPRYILIRGYDIATEYNKPYNRDMAAYFGVDSVRVNPVVPGAAF